MTALAGVVGAASAANREAATRRLLQDQRVFSSSKLKIASSDHATFGIAPHAAWGSRPVARAGEWLAVADVRLDNRKELVRRLGRAATDRNDSEILLMAWQAAGEASLDWVVGDFALAIYNPDERALILARDVAGQFPLFFARAADQTAFASMPAGLTSIVGSLTIDKLRMALTACDAGHDDRRSHFEGINRVLPGEIVRIADGKLSRSFFWHAPPRVHNRSERDWIQEYRRILDTAVARRVGGCRPVATHLSSGWDSTAVTTTAAQLVGPAGVIAFTSAPLFQTDVPEGLRRFADESAIASSTAEAAHIRHSIVRSLPPFAEVVRRQSLLCQEPILSVPNLAWTVEIRRLAAECGAERLLSGTLGNITLNTGGLYVLSEWLRLRHPLIWLRQATAAYRRSDVRLRGILFNSALPWIPPQLTKMLQRSVIGIRTLQDESFLRPEWLSMVRDTDKPRGSESDMTAPGETMARIRSLDPGLLRKGGLADHGVMELDPMGDRGCIDFAMTLPPEKRYWNGVARPLARAALADRVPAEVLNLKGRGLQGADWALRFTKKDAAEMLEEVAANSTAVELFDIQRMRRVIERWPTADSNRMEVTSEFRIALLGALSCGLFACVHDSKSAH